MLRDGGEATSAASTAAVRLTERHQIALGFRPRSVGGFWFWLRYWSPLAAAWRRWRL